MSKSNVVMLLAIPTAPASRRCSPRSLAPPTHLRIHKPVVVLPAGHPAPSGAPVEQTTETSTSSSLQLTVLSLLTIRRPALPAAPAEPAGPGEPWSPFGPGGPWSPFAPFSPGGPA